MVYRIIKYQFSPIVRRLWVKKVYGLDHIPKKTGALLAVNHFSVLDPVILAAVVPRKIYFLVGEDIYDQWALKWLFKSTGQIRVDRRSGIRNEEAIKRAVTLLEKDQCVGIFPEGKVGMKLQLRKPFLGTANIALLARSPIIPVGLRGTNNVFPIYASYPKMKREVEVHIGKPVILKESFGKEASDRRAEEIMDNIMERIGELCNVQYVRDADRQKEKFKEHIIEL